MAKRFIKKYVQDPLSFYSIKQKGFVFRIEVYVQAQAFDYLTESLSSGVGRFCYMIMLKVQVRNIRHLSDFGS